jgi:hypothetical protein
MQKKLLHLNLNALRVSVWQQWKRKSESVNLIVVQAQHNRRRDSLCDRLRNLIAPLSPIMEDMQIQEKALIKIPQIIAIKSLTMPPRNWQIIPSESS